MKWSKLQQTVASNLYTAILNGVFTYWENILIDLMLSGFEAKKGKPLTEMIKSYANAAYDAVMHWDIRSVNRLGELFPDAFPSSLRGKKLMAEMDEKGEWCVFPV